MAFTRMGTLRHTVTLTECGRQYLCREDESLLAGLSRLDVRGIPVGCRGGGCGVCKVEIIEGSFVLALMSRDHVSDADERAGRVLACRVFPRSDVRLRVLGRMQVRLGNGQAMDTLA